MTIQFVRTWSMPNKHTFLIPPIKKLLDDELPQIGLTIDPFSGHYSPADISNDIHPDVPADHHMDAIVFMNMFEDQSVDCILVDPPYSPRQITECYASFGKKATMHDTQNATLMSKIRDETARILKPGGKAICFGWNSNGIGKTRGFKMVKILMVAHGGVHNDTIATVEIKEQCSLHVHVS